MSEANWVNCGATRPADPSAPIKSRDRAAVNATGPTVVARPLAN
jgi:hypothetical protein